jgi:hypothetical protein
MECQDVDKVKPLDRLFDDQIREFNSGGDKECDKDLDEMIWELGSYENKEPETEAGEFEEEKPIEEELVEKKMIHGSNGEPYYFEGESQQEEIMAGESVVTARSISPETRRRGSKAVRGRQLRRKKK